MDKKIKEVIEGAVAAIVVLSLIAYVVFVYLPNHQPSPSTNSAGWGCHCHQLQEYTCAPCSCVSALKYFGVDSAEKEMEELCHTTGEGSSLDGVMAGLNAKLIDTNYKSVLIPSIGLIDPDNMPYESAWLTTMSIPRVENGHRIYHMICIYRDTLGDYFINDPADTQTRCVDNLHMPSFVLSLIESKNPLIAGVQITKR